MKVFILILLIALCNARDLNDASLDLIKTFEGWKPCAYVDPVGKLTIGYGHLIKPNDPYTKDSCISEEDGTDLLENDVKSASDCIDKNISVDLNDNQFGALTSWAYNVGCANVKTSTLVKILNENNNIAGVCDQLKRWNKGGGKVLNGLVRRRQAECNLFNSK